MELLQINTIEQLFDINFVNRSPNIFVTYPITTDKKIPNIRLLKAYCRTYFKNILMECQILPDFCISYVKTGDLKFYCTYYPISSTIEVSPISSSSYLYFNNENNGMVIIHIENIDKLETVLNFSAKVEQDIFCKCIVFCEKFIKQEKIFRAIKKVNPKVNNIILFMNDQIFTFVEHDKKDAYI
jgi:hypothetical protein